MFFTDSINFKMSIHCSEDISTNIGPVIVLCIVFKHPFVKKKFSFHVDFCVALPLNQ